jgi:hypothetical protein
MKPLTIEVVVEEVIQQTMLCVKALVAVTAAAGSGIKPHSRL